MSNLHTLINGFDALSGAVFGGGGGGGGGGGYRGDQSRNAEKVRAANAARAKAAAQKAADASRARDQADARRKREIQATILAAEKEQARLDQIAATKLANKKEQERLDAIAAQKAEDKRQKEFEMRETIRAAEKEQARLDQIAAANLAAANRTDKYGVTPTSMTHKNDADGINVADLDKSKTYIVGRPVDGLGAFGVQHSAQLFYNGKTKEWDTLAAHNLNGNRLTSEIGLDADLPHLPGQVVLGTVNTGHMSNQAYIERMINTDGGYNDDAEYDTIPSLTAGQGWNCNGYTMGMIDHLGATVTPFDGRDVSSLTGADTRFNFSN